MMLLMPIIDDTLLIIADDITADAYVSLMLMFALFRCFRLMPLLPRRRFAFLMPLAAYFRRLMLICCCRY